MIIITHLRGNDMRVKSALIGKSKLLNIIVNKIEIKGSWVGERVTVSTFGGNRLSYKYVFNNIFHKYCNFFYFSDICVLFNIPGERLMQADLCSERQQKGYWQIITKGGKKFVEG